MLTIEQINSQYPNRAFDSRKILTEYLQVEILDSLYKQEESRLLSFMGGTAIRIAYGGNRFSEDLDFDNFGMDFSRFSDLVGKTVTDMERKGFILEKRMVEKGTYHCYIRFPNVLKTAGISPLEEEKILIRIDTLQKKRIFSPDSYILNQFDVYRSILVNPLAIILSQKLLTALERKREKGRDFYDASFLWGRTEPDYIYLRKISGMNRKEFKQKFLKRCEKLNFKRLASDVEPFLIFPEQKERVEKFLEFVQDKF